MPIFIINKTTRKNLAVVWERDTVSLLLLSLAKVNFTLAPASETALF